MIEIFAENLHYLGDSEREMQYDLCVHGRVTVRTDKFSLEGEDEWCAGASALRFMHSVCENHFSGAEEHMIPCCGHFMIPSDDGMTVRIIGCPNGIDFDVIHEGDSVIIKTEDGRACSVPFGEYKSAVMSFAKQVEEFMQAAPARIFDGDLEKQGFSAFTNEWSSLKEKIMKTSCNK